jgi:membrane protein YqaA with SNARE-associated domain
MKKRVQVHWVRLGIAIAGFIVLSFALAYLLEHLVAGFHLHPLHFAWLAYLVVFVTSLLANLTIIAPVPFALSIMVVAATRWNPLLVALVASVGGSLGELSGYYAGYLGKKIAVPETVPGYRRFERWIQRYGVWAIALLAFQPIIPFDIGGMIAGVAKMPLYKFLPALWAGKFPKYVLLTYAGIGLIRFMPFFSL